MRNSTVSSILVVVALLLLPGARALQAESRAPLRDVVQVVGGESHTCALDRAGIVRCWGSNERSQLGLGDGALSDRTTPVPVSGLGAGVRAIAAGYFHSCAITAAGGVRCWGWNAFGALGNDSTTDAPMPIDVPGLDKGVVALSLGAVHSCALLDSGSVRCWGANGQGQLGDGSRSDRLVAVAVTGLGSGIASIHAGSEHTCAVATSGAVSCWGDNDFGQLGDGSRIDRLTPVALVGNVQQFSRVSAAARHTCGISIAGAMLCWGDLILGGDPDTDGSLVPRPVRNLPPGFSALVSGVFHSCALGNDARVRCVGDNASGQFGVGDLRDSFEAETTVGLAPGANVLGAGGFHTCAASADAGLQCWGLNTSGQLGIDSTTLRLTPTPVSGLEADVVAVASGGYHGCALTSTGAVKCWGQNNQDQIGDGTEQARLTAVGVTGLDAGVRALAVGVDHSCVITAARRAKCWGANFDGRLGTGDDLNRGTPTDVTGLGDVDVLALAQGTAHGCALLEGGAVRCWGDNAQGQVGDGSQQTRRSAVAVAGLGTGVVAITAGAYHSCAITSAGAMRCWGLNHVGQLGDGSTTDRNSPVAVSGLDGDVIAIGAGEQHTCAVKRGGAVFCWGGNFFGELLGDGSLQDRAVPGAVPALASGVVDITLGLVHSCARLERGAIQCWGENNAGAIGDNSQLSRPTPVGVAGLGSGVSQIDAGLAGQTCAVVDGAARCWGENRFGQIGDGSTYGIVSPQLVLEDALERRVAAVVPDANGESRASASDATGRYVVFQSRASNLVDGDGNAAIDIFRTDRQTGVTLRVSVDDAEAQIAADSIEPSVSAEGDVIVFVAPEAAVARLAGESETARRARAKGAGHAILMRNLVTGSTQRVGSARSSGAGTLPQLAPGATAVVFTSDTSGSDNVYHVPLVRSGDGYTIGAPRCVSCKVVDAAGADAAADADGASRNAVVSADGRWVAFESQAKNVLAAAPSPCPGSSTDILLRDMISGAMQRMSPPPATAPAACGTAGSSQPSLDYAGLRLAFQTDQPLESDDGNLQPDIYVLDTAAPASVSRVSENALGEDANGASRAPRLAGDGKSVAFVSSAQNLDLAFADNNDRDDVHAARIDDGGEGTIARLSRSASGAETDASSDQPALNYDGTRLAFDSAAQSLSRRPGSAPSVYQRSNPVLPPVRSATWWKASESGWGLTVFDQGNVLAPTWFTYDDDGEPSWLIVGGAFEQADGTYRGELLRFTGTRYDQINGAAAASVTPVGNIVLRYAGEDVLDFEYTVSGTLQRKTLARFPFGPRGFSCSATPSGVRARATNYTDLWSGADVPDAGWGLTLFHIDDGIFAIWYTYDLDGEATFFVISAERQGDGSFRGPVFKQRNGTPLLQIDEQPPSADADTVGEASFRFSDGETASFSYTIGAVSQSKAITRLVVGSRPTECTTETLPVGG